MRPYLLLVIFISYFASASEEIPELEIREIEKGIFLHKSYSQVEGWGLVSSNGLVVIKGGDAFIIDTPWSESDTENLVGWIRSKKYVLTGSISTYSHEDRTAGIKWLNEKSITTYASAWNKILKSELPRLLASFYALTHLYKRSEYLEFLQLRARFSVFVMCSL